MTEVTPSRGAQPTPPPPDVDVLRLEEVAYLLGRISPRSVRRLIATGRLKALDIIPGGTALRVHRSEVQNYLDAAEFARRVKEAGGSPDPVPAAKKAPKRAEDGHDPLRDGPRKKFDTSM